MKKNEELENLKDISEKERNTELTNSLNFALVCFAKTIKQREAEYSNNRKEAALNDAIPNRKIEECSNLDRNVIKDHLQKLGINVSESFHCPNVDHNFEKYDHFRIDAYEKSFHENWTIALNNRRTKKVTVFFVPADSLSLFDKNGLPIFRKRNIVERYELIFSDLNMRESNTFFSFKNYLVGVFDYKDFE